MKNLEKSDHELLHLVLNGGEKAFSIIFDRHWNRLYITAINLVNDRDIAEDIVQDCFVSLWEKGIYNHIENLEAYLLQTIKYGSFMHLRSGAISQKHLSRINTILITSSIEESMDASELETMVENTLHALPEKCREVDDAGDEWILYHGIDKNFPFLPNGATKRPLMLDKIIWKDGWPKIQLNEPSTTAQDKPVFHSNKN
jgi:hypothetical protein